MTDSTLKPCPFCGPGELETFRLGSIHFVQCQKCDIEQTGRSEAEAISAWNTRVNKGPAADEVADCLENALRALDGRDSELDERLCCDGHMCGCQGSTHRALLVHDIRQALAAYRESAS